MYFSLILTTSLYHAFLSIVISFLLLCYGFVMRGYTRTKSYRSPAAFLAVPGSTVALASGGTPMVSGGRF